MAQYRSECPKGWAPRLRRERGVNLRNLIERPRIERFDDFDHRAHAARPSKQVLYELGNGRVRIGRNARVDDDAVLRHDRALITEWHDTELAVEVASTGGEGDGARVERLRIRL